jgi:sulfite dehydrogenase (quinone) subunit SoeC
VNPAFSVVFFTTLAGAAQGLVVTMALAVLAGVAVDAGFAAALLGVAALMLVAGLGSSFLHLSRPGRAWRAAAMWRTSWLSREVIVLPAFIALVAAWAVVWLGADPQAGTLAVGPGALHAALAMLALLLAAVLWVCTAMIYACLRFVREWAHPLTLASFTLIGLASGSLLACALAASAGQAALLAAIAPVTLLLLLAAGLTRAGAMRRNLGLRPVSTLQSATGIRNEVLVQRSTGIAAGSFATREFFHGASRVVLRRIRAVALGCGFALPFAAALAAMLGGGAVAWWLGVALMAPGLIAERWLFFAEARHPQNLYYQVVG